MTWQKLLGTCWVSISYLRFKVALNLWGWIGEITLLLLNRVELQAQMHKAFEGFYVKWQRA